jgi:hypothetical protein
MSWSGSSDVCFELVLGRRRLSLLFLSLDFGIPRWPFMYRRLVQGVNCADKATALHTAPYHVRRVS